MMALGLDLLHDFNMKLCCDDCSQQHKANKPSPGHGHFAVQAAEISGLPKQPTAQSSLQNTALASTSSGLCPVLDLFLSFLIRQTPGQKLANDS